jgi:hypothetical protein
MESKSILYATVAALFIGNISNIEAMDDAQPRVLGKMSSGLSYIEANDTEKAAAHELALVLLGQSTDPTHHNAGNRVISAFKKAVLETAMDPDELAFELLNWPQSNGLTHANKIRFDVKLNYNDDRVATSAVQRLVSASSQISQRNAWYRRIRERAIISSTRKFTEIDTQLQGILTSLTADIASTNANSALSVRDKLLSKIDRVTRANTELEHVNTHVDFDAFLDHERQAADDRATQLSISIPFNISGYRPKVKQGVERGDEYIAINAANNIKTALAQAIRGHVASLLGEVRLFFNFEEATIEDLKAIYHKIGCMVYTSTQNTGETPRDVFIGAHFPDVLLGSKFNDGDTTKLRWELYWSLPSEITDRAAEENKDEYKVPQPMQIIPDGMKRSQLDISRTSADPMDSKDDSWGLGANDDTIL